MATSFPPPRTPKKYKRMPQPTSPLEKYGPPLPRKLPSLRACKDICRNHPESSSVASYIRSSSSEQPSFSAGNTVDLSKSPLLYEFYCMDEDVSDPSVTPPQFRFVRQYHQHSKYISGGVEKRRTQKWKGKF